jgi:hypothetical protein
VLASKTKKGLIVMKRLALSVRESNEEMIGRFLDYLHPNENVFELWADDCKVRQSRLWDNQWLKNSKVNGWFIDHDKAAELALSIDKEAQPTGVYVSLNPCDQALLARSNQILKPTVNRTGDIDIVRITNLLVDVDPKRPSGISATDEEHQLAIKTATEVREGLCKLEWPEPLFVRSGNGVHLIWKVDLENNLKNVELIKNCVKAIALQHSNPDVEIDVSVCNAGRMVRLPGTVARKGDDLDERPHRLAEIVFVPDSIELVSLELLRSLAKSGGRQHARPSHGGSRGSKGKLDVGTYLKDHDVTVVDVKETPTGTLYLLESCLFDPSHTEKEASIIQNSSGKLFYQCFHNSCRDKKWKDARRLISGDDDLSQFNLVQDQTKDSQATLLLDLTEELELFHAPDGDCYASVLINGNSESLAINSKEFRSWLPLEFFNVHAKGPQNNAIQDCLRMIEGKARFEGPEIEVHIRIAEANEKIYLDLADTERRVVEISPSGWGIIQQSPVKFRRPKGMMSLPLPEDGGSLEELKAFINFRNKNDFILIRSYLVMAFIPKGPYQILILQGEQGSAKSTACRIIKSFISPSKTSLLSPRN